MGGERGRSKAAIAVAAARLFAEQGFAGTTVRQIAREASADPALVIRHYGSKEELFLHTMHVSASDMPDFGGPVETLGRRIVEFVVDAGDDVRATYLALIRASDTGEVGFSLNAAHENGFVRPLRDLLDGDDRELRARLVASMVGGLMYSLWIVEDRELTRADRAALVGTMAPSIQRLLTPEV